jgi:hypothetical protein
MDLRNPYLAAQGTDHSASAVDEFRLLLCALADPQAPAPPLDVVLAADPNRLFASILHHGIEPVALPKLTGLLPRRPPYVALINGMRARQFLANAHCLKLDAVAKRLRLAIETAGFQAALVKGSVFAVTLYRKTSQRPFSEIDILVRDEALRPVGPLLKKQGFRRRGLQLASRLGLGQTQTWIGREDPSIRIRLHRGLVGAAIVRRRVSFGLDEYRIAGGNGAHPAVANFLAAVLHATTIAGMRDLQSLVDVLQALRQLDDDDVAHLSRVLPLLRVRPEVLVCLDIVGALFGDPSAAYVLERLLAGSRFRFGRRLLSPATVLGTAAGHAGTFSFRHRLFRVFQVVAPRG